LSNFEEQQPFSQSLPPQHAAAVLSFPHLSPQQEPAILPLSPFMHDFASFPAQQEAAASFPAQQEAISLPPSAFIRAQDACPSFASADPILSQQPAFALSAGAVLCCGAEGAV
jgi:hypothetical protein